MNFPFHKTKIEGVAQTFKLADPVQRQEYFYLKVGPEIEKIREYLVKNSFIVYLLGKKNSGKGTYAKLFLEIFGPEKTAQVSIGDLVRRVHQTALANGPEKDELVKFLEKNYRGYISIEEALEALLGRDVKKLLPSEFILALVKREIAQFGKKALFLDGFPRNLDQISYSLFFRDLIGYRDDPDIFVLIDIPEKVIEERMKYRVVCPRCQTTPNLKLNPTKRVGYDEVQKEFYLICDNPACRGQRLNRGKEGDNLGLEALRERLTAEENLMKEALKLHGVPKILLRNHLPVDRSLELADQYEITPEYSYEWLEQVKEVRVLEKPWIFPDDDGVPSVSLLAPAVVVSLIKQLAQTLNL
ncbi:MAG: nucleoside monophosphate kinase [bacterium]|nr:nucleoside monophosphate kinase [bacterium]